MTTLKYVFIRLYLYFLFALFFITGGLSLFILAPLYKAALAPRVSYRDINPFRVWSCMFRIAWRTLTSKNYRSIFPIKLTDPPKLHTDLKLVRVKDSWQGAKDNCDLCQASCCMALRCPLLGENGRCLGYDSWFFNYFYCGRYPENQGQIDYYKCPKWEVRPDTE